MGDDEATGYIGGAVTPEMEEAFGKAVDWVGETASDAVEWAGEPSSSSSLPAIPRDRTKTALPQTLSTPRAPCPRHHS